MSSQKAGHQKEGFVVTAGHGRMHYLEAGTGIPVILIHTNGGSARQFEQVLGQLSKDHRAIAWEMPGHGDADPVSRHYTIEDYCDALAHFMDALGIPAAHISGTSCGGTITACFASRFASRTLSAVIVETPLRTSAEWGERWDHTEGNFGIPSQGVEEIKKRVADVDDAFVARWNIDRNKAGAKLMMSVMWAMRDYDIQAAISAITRPAMMLYGARGPTIAMRDRLPNLAPKMPVTVLGKSGHFPMLDEPAEFAQALSAFARAATS
jgi:3-oxoadipate enol-lactonase